MANKTLSELIADVRDLTNDGVTNPDGTAKDPRHTNAQIVSRLNDGCLDILKKTINQDNSPWSGSFATANNTREYRLTTYPLKVLWVSLVDGSGNEEVLPCVERSTLDLKAPLWRGDGTGTPVCYYVEGDVVGFYYTPNAAYTINYGYIRLPNVFAATDLNTEPFNGEIALYPVQAAIALYAAHRISIADEKDGKALNFSYLYAQEIKDIRKYLDNRNPAQKSLKLVGSRGSGAFDWLYFKTP